MKYIYMRRTDLIPIVIMTACILHNICIDNNDEITIEDDANFNDNINTRNDSAAIVLSSAGAERETI